MSLSLESNKYGDDYLKVFRTIISSTTPEQIKSSKKMLNLFRNKWGATEFSEVNKIDCETLAKNIQRAENRQILELY